MIGQYFKIISIIFFIFISSQLFSQKRADLEKMRKAKLKEMENIENLLSKTKKDKSLTISQINLLSRKIIIRNEIIETLNDEIKDIEFKINILSSDINYKNDEVTKLKTEYAKIVYSSYYRLKNFNPLLFIVSSSSFNQAYRRFYFLKQYTVHRKNVLRSIISEINTIENNISELKTEKDKKEILLSNREDEMLKLEEDKKQQKQQIDEINSKEISLKSELKDLQAATKKIEKEIENIIREEALAKVKRSKKAVAADIVLTKNFADNRGKLPWPVENGSIVSMFGEHPHPVFKGIIIKNDGIDISTNCNSAVRCIFNGVVSKIFVNYPSWRLFNGLSECTTN
jgi:septal ring factor EnvC (AmiA/AmiB activator)